MARLYVDAGARLAAERFTSFGIRDVPRQQRDIFFDVGWLDLVSGREPRGAGILGELPTEWSDLDDKEPVDIRANAQQDR